MYLTLPEKGKLQESFRQRNYGNLSHFKKFFLTLIIKLGFPSFEKNLFCGINLTTKDN